MSLRIVLMGVSGCGKTTIGRALAESLGCPFLDGDDYHPPENVAKMAGGIPLTDDDRKPWLEGLHGLLLDHARRDQTVVLACSALKRRYREMLRGGVEGFRLFHLKGDIELIRARMAARPGHYMKPGLLQSQFDTLEPPGPDEAVTIDIAEPVDAILQRILNEVGAPR
jgi:gluconokinase